MQKGKIGISTENIFPIIKKYLYSDHEIFLRELISNAVDATQKLNTLSRIGDYKGEVGDTTIRVSFDEKKKTITISDRGIGMTTEEIEIHTLSLKDDAKAVKWECDGSPEYTIEEIDKKERGTDIVLFIDEENEHFVNKDEINRLLKKYCGFLPVPIAFGKQTEWKDGKEVEKDEENIINDTNPLWTQAPANLKDEEYKKFYHDLYPMAEDPLFHIHLNVDYPFNLTGILYFPKISNNIEVQRNKIQLYCNQVYVTDSVEGIVPEFLTLLHGVIDSPDIPLNVSRSYLQSDSNVKKISSHITKKVADRLDEIFKSDRQAFEAKWDDLKVFIEYGMLTDEKFNDRAQKFALLKNTDGKFFTFDEYKNIIQDNQTDKDKQLVYLYATDAEGQFSFIEADKNKGYDVLLMDERNESNRWWSNGFLWSDA
jgi:molecular chaperone HtpG